MNIFTKYIISLKNNKKEIEKKNRRVKCFSLLSIYNIYIYLFINKKFMYII